MTQKIALSLALFATVGLTACTVDSPTPEEFTYSFQEELPGTPSASGTLRTPPKQPLSSQISVEFRDSLHGTDDVPESIVSVPLQIDGVRLGTEDEEGNMVWHSLTSKLVEVDLMTLSDGDAERLAFGPAPEGQYSAIAFKIASAQTMNNQEELSELGLPGPVVVIEREFYLQAFEEHDFVVQFGGLRGLESTSSGWITEPNVTFFPLDED